MSLTEIIIRLPEVMRQTSLPKSTIYDQIRAGVFPEQVPLGKKLVGWKQSEIDAYKAGAFSAREAAD